VCFFATDIHSATLGRSKKDDSLVRVRKGDLTGKGELMVNLFPLAIHENWIGSLTHTNLKMIFGKQDTHVPLAGRTLIRQTLDEANVLASFLEVQAQHAFIRDESSKGRWDAALTRNLFGMMMELFDRTVGRDLGPKAGTPAEPEHVC
jgi:carboxymethylenebutenolidase